MVSKAEKNYMTIFLTNRLEDSGLYNILKRGSSIITIAEKPDVREVPKTIHVLAHASKMTKSNFKVAEAEDRREGIFTCHVFYKDGKTFMVRMGGKAKFKGDYRSFKNYTQEQLNNTVHLRGLEKLALDNSASHNLAYYQPETERLKEGIRIYQMEDIILDYTHIQPGDSGYGFVENKESIDFKIATETENITSEPVQFQLFTSKRADLIIHKRLSQLTKRFKELLANEDGTYDTEERTSIFLDGCFEEDRKYLTKKFGPKKLGGYASD